MFTWYMVIALYSQRSTFFVKILFSDMDDDSSVDLTEKVGLPVEAFSNVHEFFNQVAPNDVPSPL